MSSIICHYHHHETKLTYISGASLSYDAPSYFTNYFSQEGNAEKTLYIDRSPDVFRLIYSHLQGYYLQIDDPDTYTKVFIDSLYYNLPRLRALILNSEYYFANIGGTPFKIPKQFLSGPGNTPNFFTIGSEVIYKDISDVIFNMNWIRPPPQAATTLNRCDVLFKELMLALQGVDIKFRSEDHRRALIREARYYRFNGLVQKLVKHKISYNPFTRREEIIMGLEYLDPKGITLSEPESPVLYQRPFVDDKPRPLVIQIDDPEIEVPTIGKVNGHDKTGKLLAKLFKAYGDFIEDGECVFDLILSPGVLPLNLGKLTLLRCLIAPIVIEGFNRRPTLGMKVLKADVAVNEQDLYKDTKFL